MTEGERLSEATLERCLGPAKRQSSTGQAAVHAYHVDRTCLLLTFAGVFSIHNFLIRPQWIFRFLSAIFARLRSRPFSSLAMDVRPYDKADSRGASDGTDDDADNSTRV